MSNNWTIVIISGNSNIGCLYLLIFSMEVQYLDNYFYYWKVQYWTINIVNGRSNIWTIVASTGKSNIGQVMLLIKVQYSDNYNSQWKISIWNNCYYWKVQYWTINDIIGSPLYWQLLWLLESLIFRQLSKTFNKNIINYLYLRIFFSWSFTSKLTIVSCVQ